MSVPSYKLIRDSRIVEHIGNVMLLGSAYTEENFCVLCKEVGVVRKYEHLHHLFSQTKENKKKYGEAIHHPYNVMKLCSICHESKEIPKMSEQEFCMAVGVECKSKIERPI